ncbi:hypothetical protein Dsin_027320 [Dipteronia sinensis]|uniref:Pectinesterase inhibitor domain-containing protein n=1 Tax=Dipteronia sinensis TaxID=43782 RepID=A0AAD9ZNP4_9ROSI|nr:hypothetical protein Dsin_027320 [Dipteronia sinensis]
MVSFKSYFFQVSILGVLLFITPSNASSKIINDICPKTRSPSICMELLQSTPGAAAADLKGLGKITLNLAHSTASKTLGQINSLIPKTTDPKLTEIYKSCSEQYGNVIGSLKEAETDFNQGDYFSMNSQASAAMTEVGDCRDETAKLAVDPSVKKGNLDFDHIWSHDAISAEILAINRACDLFTSRPDLSDRNLAVVSDSNVAVDWVNSRRKRNNKMVSFKSYFFQVSILGVLLFITPSNASSKIINDICPKTRFPSICMELLQSTPGAAAADLKGLGKITLNLAHSTASKTLGQINSLIPKTTDPKLTEIYKSCSEQYGNVIGSLKEAETDFNQGDYFSMNSQASAAMTEVGDCRDETAKLAVDPSVKKGNLDFDHISTADLKGLAKIILDLARSNASKTLDQIHSLIPKTTDRRLKESYQSCSEHYDNATDDLDEAESDFEQGDYFGMNEAWDCDDETEGLPANPSLRMGNQD